MSLINKMLQDLDARGSKGGAELPPDIRAAAMSERRLPRKQVIIAASALTIAAAVAAVIWHKRSAPAGEPLVTAPVVVVAAPTPVPVPVPVPKNSYIVVPPAPPAPVPAAVSISPALPPSPTFAAERGDAVKSAPKGAVQENAVAAVARRPRERSVRVVQAESEAPLPRSVPAGVPVGREVSVPQRAENAYRQALASLDEGKMSTAYAALEQALKLNPRHDAARQSLVSLLIEDGRNDEAMQQLEQGHAADAGQPSLAMLLARMQIERGMSGIATLQRTLPAAAGNGDYHAFLAGALQREQRHREAIDQYAAALRITPNHGVWLMGMGISLQAEKRPRDAAEAFSRAKASGMLTPALDTFVERKLQQLAQ